MLKIVRCTLTGADDNTAIEEMVDITQAFPFVEWGVLFSKAKAGTQRYPTLETIEEIVKTVPSNNLAAHLCGSYTTDICKVDMGDPAMVDGLFHLINENFQRLQYNYNFGKDGIPSGVDEILFRMKPKLILQHNKSNASAINELIQMATFLGYYRSIPHILFDASGGRGTLPDMWPIPVAGTLCGYAGGLNPDNLRKALEAIGERLRSGVFTIDMETGIRTNNEFDLIKCIEVLEIVREFNEANQ